MSTRKRDRERERTNTERRRTNWREPGGRSAAPTRRVVTHKVLIGLHSLPCILVCIVFETIYKEVDLTQNKVAMAEKFIGKYRFVSSENFDEFMKALGVNYLLRKIANAASPVVEFSLDRDVWTLRNVSTFRTLEISFRLGEEVDEVTPDGRHVKTVFTYENGELKQVQKAVKPGEKDSIFIRKLEGDKLITTCICGNVTSIRVLQRIKRWFFTTAKCQYTYSLPACLNSDVIGDFRLPAVEEAAEAICFQTAKKRLQLLPTSVSQTFVSLGEVSLGL
ncbi:Fatty acid-binding -like protein 6 [Trichinella spiralis]|uniref:Fatty acid-binding-like protein 6 n=1 Tax=Trichinella spiralis TaxID=6334 RepID=A0A0V1BKA8_TRISP|nr:Fatty acid-binding -like protein 6 [Trichinella spiralis]